MPPKRTLKSFSPDSPYATGSATDGNRACQVFVGNVVGSIEHRIIEEALRDTDIKGGGGSRSEPPAVDE
jgi:hypothetical protein